VCYLIKIVIIASRRQRCPAMTPVPIHTISRFNESSYRVNVDKTMSS